MNWPHVGHGYVWIPVIRPSTQCCPFPWPYIYTNTVNLRSVILYKIYALTSSVVYVDAVELLHGWLTRMSLPRCRCNTLRPRQNGRHFADDTFNRIFLKENVRISIKISLKFVPKSPIDNIPALFQIMAWRRPGDKPLSEAIMVSLLTHIWVVRPQWVNISFCKRGPVDITIHRGAMASNIFGKLTQILRSVSLDLCDRNPPISY